MKFYPVLKLVILITILFTATISTNAQYGADTVFTFIQDTYNRQDKKLNDFLILELNQFVDNFPESEKAIEATYLLGKVYEVKGKKYEAIATYFKIMFLYPDSTHHKECADIIREIIKKKRINKDKIEKMHLTLNIEFGGETAADRYYAYLNFLTELDESNLYEWTLMETRRFISRFPNDQRLDMVLRWIGDIYANKNQREEALISYIKLDYTHPESPLLPYTRFSRGMLLYKKFNQPEQAKNVFSEIVPLFPESEYAGSALFRSGEIKEKKLKDYEGAIKDYRNLADIYPKHERAIPALFAIAELYSKKLNEYLAAVDVYNEIVEKYQSKTHSIDALIKIGDLYKDKIKIFAKSAEYYAKIAELYPDYDKGPDMLLKAASVCEKELKDYQKVIDYCQIILDKYPEHKKAKDAEKKILKAKEKLTNEN